jgi:hypothetical protein
MAIHGIRIPRECLRDTEGNPALPKPLASRVLERVEARLWNIEQYLTVFCIDAINNCVAGASSS